MQPPKIDRRDMAALIEQMKEMAPYYTPEWRFSPEDPDPGTALFLLFAEMFHENVKRLNRVPMKHFIAFMNMLDVSLLPARPAHANLTFRLNSGVREPVLVPAGTQVAAPAADGDGEVLFETERGVVLTPAALVAAFAASIRQDTIVRIPDAFIAASNAGEASSSTLFGFEGDNLQEHCLYLEHGDLFEIVSAARIEIELGNSHERFRENEMAAQLANRERAEWLYASAEGWTRFDDVRAQGNRIVLTKSHVGQLVEREVGGYAGKWIRCRLRENAAASGADGSGEAAAAAPAPVQQRRTSLLAGGFEIDSIALKTDYADIRRQGGIAPTMMFFNDIQVNPAGFYPFGELFAPYSTFYVASREVFSKRGGTIAITFQLDTVVNRLQAEVEQPVDWKLVMKKNQFEKPELPPISIAQVLWEYWNGSAWVRLTSKKEHEELFYRPGERSAKRVTFRCPDDLQETFVNAQYDYWIRVRVLNVENLYSAQSDYLSPWIEEFKLTYQYGDRKYPANRCLTQNNMAFADRTGHAMGKAGVFAPFYPPEGKHAALHLAFDQPPVKGPISLYVSVRTQRYAEQHIPLMEWEYWGEGDGSESAAWKRLKVIDDTNGLTQSGTVLFAGPGDYVSRTLFGTEGYWLRVVNRDDKYDDPGLSVPVPTANGLYLNTVRAVQQESVTGEFPEKRGYGAGVEYQLDRTPVIAEEIWVDEAEELTDEEIASVLADERLRTDVIRDTDGNVQRLWIMWSETDSFADSGANDRHYTIDRTSGRIRFGDGVHGMTPPEAGLERIKAHYKVTQGRKGNVPAGSIVSLQQSIAFVGSVANPELASGGSDAESLDDALVRGPQLLKHRGRAVTPDDYEWLAREAYPGIAKVKCLAGYNARMERDIGSITLVVLPKDGIAGRNSFPELKRQVERHLCARAANLVAFPERIQVIEPAYVEISITAVLAASGIDHIVPTELAALDRLNRFLDPLTGGYDGKGWAIGQQLHQSVFYALLKSIPTVNHVEKLFMTVHKLEDGVRTELDANGLGSLLHGIVTGGKHNVSVTAI